MSGYPYRAWHDYTFIGGAASESTINTLNALEDLVGPPVYGLGIAQLSFENWIVVGINFGILYLGEALDIRDEVFAIEPR